MVKENRTVSETDLNLYEQHILHYSDERQFTGYESEGEALLERSLKASESVRGEALEDVFMKLDRQSEIVERKREALVNLLAQDNDEAYHLDETGVKSFVSKMVDDYAVSDYIRSEAEKMNSNLYQRYYEDGDPKLTYATYAFGGDENHKFSGAYDVDSDEELLKLISRDSESITSMDTYGADEFGYIEGESFMNGVSENVMYRNQEIGTIWGFLKQNEEGEYETDYEYDIHDKTSFISINSDDPETMGIFQIEDGDVYRYSMDETEVQKISGKDSVLEARSHNSRSRMLHYYQKSRFEQIVNDIEQETGRAKDFDFDSINPNQKEPFEKKIPSFEWTDIELERMAQEDWLEL